MPACSYPLEELLPHRPPMVLIDEVVSLDVDNRSLVAAVTIRPEWSENWVAIEFMAQSAAALAGCFDKIDDPNGPAKPGFLLGTRRMDLSLACFEVGRRYLISVRNEFFDNEAASFDCRIADEHGNEVASAILNAYRPRDIGQFLSEQRASTPNLI